MVRVGFVVFFPPIPDSVGEIEIVRTEALLIVQISCRNVENEASGFTGYVTGSWKVFEAPERVCTKSMYMNFFGEK